MTQVAYPAKGLSGVFEQGITLHEAVRKMGYVIDYACGGNALCGTCCVRVARGSECLTPAESEEREILREIDAGPGHRLACQARIHDSVEGDLVLFPVGQ